VDGDVITPGGITVPNAAIAWRFSRGTGPGGQGVNTTDSRVELVADLTLLEGDPESVERIRTVMGDRVRIVVATERSQLRNRETAAERLAARIDAAAIPTRRRRQTRPTTGSVAERLQTKTERGQIKARRRIPDADD